MFRALPSARARLASPAALLLAFAVLVALRMPQVWLNGRFWAEEGAVYFMNARDEPWYDALCAVHTGYMNLAASIATLLAARLVPLAAAPWVSTTVALAIQLCPAILLATSGVAWLRRPGILAAALLMLLIPKGSGEVWLNSITSQFHLGVCVALILALPVQAAGWVGAFRVGLLVLAPLSGPASAFLVPLFLLRAALDRSPGRLAQGVLLGAMAAVQVLMVVLHPEPGRSIGIGPRLLALVVYEKQLMLPLLGAAHTMELTDGLAEDVRAGQAPWAPMLAALAACAIYAFAAWRTRDAFVRWIAAGAGVVMLMSYVGALGDHVYLLYVAFGDRYTYAPDVLLGLGLLGMARTSPGLARAVATLLVVWIAVIGMNDYFWVGRDFATGAPWPEEVARWRADPSYRVHLWPSALDIWHWPMKVAPGD